MDNLFQLVPAILLSVGSGGAIVLGMSGWLGKVWADRLMEREKASLTKLVQSELEQLRGATERNLFVHRTQFEVEFKAYQELWAAIFEAVIASLALRPVLDHVPSDKSKEELKVERLSRYRSQHNATLVVWRRYRPFITTDIDSMVEGLLRETRNEALQYEIFEPNGNHKDYWDGQKANADMINASSDSLCAAIRERVGLMTPIG